MMNRNWKKKTMVAIVAMAMVMQQLGGSSLVLAKASEEIEQKMESVSVNTDFDDQNWDDENEDDQNWDDENEDDQNWDDESGDGQNWDDESGDSQNWDDESEDGQNWDDESEDGQNWDDESGDGQSWNDESGDGQNWDDESEEEGFIEPSISKTSLSLKAGKTGKLYIDGDFEDVIWKSNNKKVAKVDQNSGKVTGVKAGTTWITATVYYYDDTMDEWESVDEDLGEGEEASEDAKLKVKTFRCKVKVSAPVLKINTKKATLKVKKSIVLKIAGATGKVTWTSKNKKIAKVSSTGKVTALKPGSTTIIGKTGGKTFVCKITVKKK